MTDVTIDRTLAEWDEATKADDRDIWVEHLDRVPVCDFLPVLAEQEALTRGSKQLTLSQWLNHMGGRRVGDVLAEEEAGSTSPHVRLAAATYLRWIDRIETLLRTSRLPNLPTRGVVQYFTDHLAASVLIGYKRIGSTVQLENLLAIPNPEAYLDPLRALRFAETPAQLELLRRSLYSRHKIVIQRNTLLHIDRERAPDVFGPTIDTLFLNDWLHANRYARQRTGASEIYFEDPVPREPTLRTLEEGCSFLEIGCGNGLLTASFAKNEAKIRAIAAIDVSHAAVSATYENLATQRQFHGSGISDRAHLITGRYELETVPHQSDLVVCNPPYIPEQPGRPGRRVHPLAPATVGTALLQQVLKDAPSLIRPGGELLIISSALAEPEIKNAVSNEMSIEEVARRLVPFDIEAIRGEDEDEYVSWLRTERGLGMRGRILLHNIVLLKVKHSTGSHLTAGVSRE